MRIMFFELDTEPCFWGYGAMDVQRGGGRRGNSGPDQLLDFYVNLRNNSVDHMRITVVSSRHWIRFPKM